MKILIAEDDPVALEAINACLVGEGFETIQAANGTEALAKWQGEAVDLFCLDVMMPGMDGFEVCRRIRSKNDEVPVIFLSAKNEEIDVVVGLELGADDFVRKPFGKHELLARIRSVLRRRHRGKQSDPPASFVVRNELRVYPTQLRAVRIEGDDEISLVPREIAILKLLADHAGEAVSRDTLLDECWGLSYFPESRSLDQYIAQLRKKIEVDPASPRIIETVRGVGYRISP